MTAPRLRIVVCGLVGLNPIGGVAWDYLQYVLGLHRLGHDVHYYEDTWSWPYDPIRKTHTDRATYSVDFLRGFFDRFAPDLVDRWRYVHLHDRAYGVKDESWADVLRTADVFLNVSGVSIIPDELNPACVKVFVDTDPGYNQIVMTERPEWSENIDRWIDLIAAHDVHFTYAENIDRDDCLVPRAGIKWLTTRMPVDIDIWKGTDDPSAASPWTTVMTWNAFKGPLLFQGREYRSKGAEFERLFDLPSRTRLPLEVAVGGAAPVERLRRSGWTVTYGPAATRSPQDYLDYLANSRGEVSTAKHVYVELRTGWFSTRSACYLAAGRPVVVQDTGFGDRYPTGSGLIVFRDADEALAGVEAASADIVAHSRAAREIAGDYFGAPTVLGRLLRDIGA